MRKPIVKARLEYVRRKADRRAKEKSFPVVEPACTITNEDLRNAGVGFQGSDRDWLEALGATRTDFATGLTQADRLRAAKQLVGEEVDGPMYTQGRSEGRSDVHVQLRKIVDPLDGRKLNIDGLLDAVRHLKNDSAIKLLQYLDDHDLDELAIDVDADSYIKELVKANLDLIQKNYGLEVRLMQYDQRRLDEKTVGRWLNPDPHLQAENERLKAINAKLHDALLKEKP